MAYEWGVTNHLLTGMILQVHPGNEILKNGTPPEDPSVSKFQTSSSIHFQVQNV